MARRAVFAILERHRSAYVVTSAHSCPACSGPRATWSTCGGTGRTTQHLYAGSYGEDDLRWWADRLREWEDTGQPVYGYFNNDQFGYAATNAVRLLELLEQG